VKEMFRFLAPFLAAIVIISGFIGVNEYNKYHRDYYKEEARKAEIEYYKHMESINENNIKN
jgi:hypothetical protein